MREEEGRQKSRRLSQITGRSCSAHNPASLSTSTSPKMIAKSSMWRITTSAQYSAHQSLDNTVVLSVQARALIPACLPLHGPIPGLDP